MLLHLAEQGAGGLHAITITHLLLANLFRQRVEVVPGDPLGQFRGGYGFEELLNGHAQLASQEEVELPLGLGY
ncbi:MAG: hypothetical protein COA41_12360 [Sphingopyxis sp.]|nr:MAG: hypothetical protein COA41_12360 [Sphingopyxis sp.]